MSVYDDMLTSHNAKTPKRIFLAVVGGLLFAIFIAVTVHLMVATFAPAIERVLELEVPR